MFVLPAEHIASSLHLEVKYGHVPDGASPNAPNPHLTLYARIIDGCRSLEYFHLSGVRLYRTPRVPLAFDTIAPCPMVSHVWIEGHPLDPVVMRQVFPNIAYLQLDAIPESYNVTHVKDITSSWKTLRVLVVSLRRSDTFPSILACASLPNLVVLSFEASVDEQILRADDRLAFITPKDIEKVRKNSRLRIC